MEVGVSAVSDSIFRALYYLVALRSATNYAKLYGLERKLIILFEEPEAHIFPFFLNTIATYIAKATETLYVVVTTHNPLLVSMLWDLVKNVKTYYTFRDKKGSTRLKEIDITKMAKDVKTIENILFMPPSEIIEKYSVRT